MICMEREPIWGFLHKTEVHKGVCDTCYQTNYNSMKKLRCPKCRKKVERIVKVYE